VLIATGFGKIAPEGNYDNFGIALVSRKGSFVATKMSALITSRSGDCWSRFKGGIDRGTGKQGPFHFQAKRVGI
jgi:hypothetical protein